MDKRDVCSATSSTRQVAYLAGPMRGIHEYNFPAFYAAAAALRAHGLDVWSPAENDVNQDGFDPAKDTAHPMRHYMKRDLPAVLNADMVCVLPGWEKSQGAQLEVHVARACGIPVYNAHDLSSVPSARVLPSLALAYQQAIRESVGSILSQYAADLILKRAEKIEEANNG